MMWYWNTTTNNYDKSHVRVHACTRAHMCSADCSRQALQGRFLKAYLLKLICRSNFLRADFADQIWQSRLFKALFLFIIRFANEDVADPMLKSWSRKAAFAGQILQSICFRAHPSEQILQSRFAKADLLDTVLPEQVCQKSVAKHHRRHHITSTAPYNIDGTK